MRRGQLDTEFRNTDPLKSDVQIFRSIIRESLHRQSTSTAKLEVRGINDGDVGEDRESIDRCRARLDSIALLFVL